MRSIFIGSLCLLVSLLGHTQSLNDSVNLKPFLFEKFIEGTVLMKSGVIEQAPLNYNTDNQTLVFIQNGQYMVFADLEEIDTVYLQQKKFIAINKTIYQVVNDASPVALLVAYSNKIRPVVATTDHRGTSKQAGSEVSNTVSDVYVSRIFKENYSVEILKHYWFAKNDRVYKVDSKKKFLNSFSSKARKAIENYMAANNISFSNESDLTRLVDFCNTTVQ